MRRSVLSKSRKQSSTQSQTDTVEEEMPHNGMAAAAHRPIKSSKSEDEPLIIKDGLGMGSPALQKKLEKYRDI
jgi:hypothetical protein